MKKEFLLIAVVGFIILAYVIDAVANPLNLSLASPYHFFVPQNLQLYPFTIVSITLKALALVMAPLLILSALGVRRFTQAVCLLVLSGLFQLYALQDIATKSFVVPLEWSLGFTLAGLVMIIPMLLFLIASPFEKKPESTPDSDSVL